MQAKSKNLIIGCIATMAIVATISTVHGHVCLDKPFTSHEHTWEIIEIKEGKEYISCPCGCVPPAGERALGRGHDEPAVADTSLVYLCTDLTFYDLCFFHEIFFSVHACPLEWSEWLWYKE